MMTRAVRLAREASVRQDTILLEAIQRVRRHAGLREDQLHQRPMVIVVTKWDSWKNLLPDLSNEAPYFDIAGQPIRTLNMDRIRYVSSRVESLLQSYCPEIVASAQGFVQDLTFIPVSATGRGPERDPKTGSLGIRPRDIEPYWVEVPLLFALSQWARGLIGTQQMVSRDASGKSAVESNSKVGPNCPQEETRS
jgi:hypothetical protein